MKYCSKCGAELYDEAVICPKCGCAVEEIKKEEETKKNTIAIVGFILSFFFAVAGLVLGIIGLIQSKKTNDGKALSIAAIAISAVTIFWIAFLIVFMLIEAASV